MSRGSSFRCERCELRVLDTEEEWGFLERYGACPRCKAAAPEFTPREVLQMGPPPIRHGVTDPRAPSWEAVRTLADLHRKSVFVLLARLALAAGLGATVGVALAAGSPQTPVPYLIALAFLSAAAVAVVLALVQAVLAWRLAEATGLPGLIALLVPLGLIGLVVICVLLLSAVDKLRRAGIETGLLGVRLPESPAVDSVFS